jgi:phage shock protein A
VVFRIEKLEDRAARGEAATAAVVSDVDRLKKRVDLLEGVKIKTVTDRFRVVKVAPATAPIPASSVEPTWKMW